MSTNLTRVTTMLELNFHPETGHVTKMLEKHDKKIGEHDTDIKRAKWTVGLASPLIGALALWAKSHIGWKS